MPEPWLMGAGEISERLCLSRQRVQQLAERDDFPVPFADLKMGRIWWRQDVELWIAGWRDPEGEPYRRADCRRLAERIADILSWDGQVFVEDDQIEVLSGVLRHLLNAAGIRSGAGGSG